MAAGGRMSVHQESATSFYSLANSPRSCTEAAQAGRSQQLFMCFDYCEFGLQSTWRDGNVYQQYRMVANSSAVSYSFEVCKCRVLHRHDSRMRNRRFVMLHVKLIVRVQRVKGAHV